MQTRQALKTTPMHNKWGFSVVVVVVFAFAVLDTQQKLYNAVHCNATKEIQIQNGVARNV